MNLQLHLSPEMGAQLTKQAALAGKDPETMALEALQERLSAEPEDPPRRDHAAWVAKLKACIALHPVVDHFVDDSRESIYEGRGEWRILVDTNILVRLAEIGHPQQSIAEAAITKLESDNHELCLVPQAVYEYWVDVTRPVAQNGLGMTTVAADEAVESWLGVFTLLLDERGVFRIWRELVRQHAVAGKLGHDVRLVAAMQRHGLSHILTFNGRDFQRFAAVQVLDPSHVSVT